MTVLSGKTIRELMIVKPLELRHKVAGMSAGLGFAGYDVTADLGREDKQIVLLSGESRLIPIREELDMPNNVMGFIYPKSTWARVGMGLICPPIEPGWKGFLTLAVRNTSSDRKNRLLVRHGDPIAQLVFQFVDRATTGYDGKYQNQERGPQGARYE